MICFNPEREREGEAGAGPHLPNTWSLYEKEKEREKKVIACW
jgi:hypothetical protein